MLDSRRDMWSHLFISVAQGSASWVNYPIALLEEQIARAGKHPLRVTLISEEKSGYTTAKILTAIMHSCARWETLELFSEWVLPTTALCRMLNNIPLLREINICAESDLETETGYVDLGMDIFEFVPSLRLVRITEPPVDNPMGHGRGTPYGKFMWPFWSSRSSFEQVFPWAQRTHYESQCADRGVPFPSTRFARRRISLYARRRSEWMVALDSDCCTSRALHVPEKLILSVCATAGLLFDRVVMPAQQDFFIQASPADFHHIVSLVQRSQCSLRKFWVNTAPDSMHYRQILLANADIVELGIMNSVTNVIPSLFVDAAVLLVPRLRTFSIHHEFDFNMRSVLDMAWGCIGAGLERLCITTRRSVFSSSDQRRRGLYLERTDDTGVLEIIFKLR
ncbi:hypothetical protein FB451DRAFT_1552828, partial [Mycena latifolia]